MERRRSQQQRIKQQRQRRCASQQDLTGDLHLREHETHRSLTNIPSSTEGLHHRSVSQLINDFEARAQESPPVANDVFSSKGESNCSHMFIETRKIKGNHNDSDIIHKTVCSPISPVIIDDDSRKVTLGIHRHQHTGDDKEHEKREQVIHQTLNNDRQHQDVSVLSICTSEHKNNNHPHRRQMLTRSTDIDTATITSNQRHKISFRELMTKEAQLNSALADLLSISNDGEQCPSMASSPRSLAMNNDYHTISAATTNKNNTIAANIDVLNSLLETLNLDHEEFANKTRAQENNTSSSLEKHDDNPMKPVNMFCLMLSDNICANCQQSFATNEQIVNAAGHIWHTHCFVCTQCFQPFENGIYFEHEDRKYCERDFQMLFAPCCAECKQAIVGRVIRAIQKCFHPDCFRCQLCQIPLIEMGFSKYNGRALCRECHATEKAKDSRLSQHVCSKCHQIIEHHSLKYKDEFYHPHHFHCTSCQAQLDENGREVRGLLYCLSCHNKLDVPVCGACRRLIDGRVIGALGKQWHVEHFCCARCAQPFHGSKHFENKGLAYCESDYHLLFGSLCFTCNTLLTESAYTACNKKYCADHFACSLCEKKMNEKSKFFDVDATPVCKQCYGKLSSKTRKSLEQQQKKKQLSSLAKQSTA